jgi:hypothetical protein
VAQRLAIIKLRGMLAVVACTAFALATALVIAHPSQEGDPILGFSIIVACVGFLAWTEAARRLGRLPTEGAQCGGKWKAILKSIAFATIAIGVPDTVFVSCYLYLHVTNFGMERLSERQDPKLNLAAMMVAFSVAVGVAVLLRLLLLSGGKEASRRSALMKTERVTSG